MDRQLPKEIIEKRRRKRLMAGISVLASIMIIVWVIGKIGTWPSSVIPD